jgi:hypothetical protein
MAWNIRARKKPYKERAMNSSTTSNSMNGYMQDSQGRFVPVDKVKDIDKLRDQTVKEIVDKVKKMQEVLAKFKTEVRNDLFSYLSLSYEKYGKKFGGKKGNVTMSSYDGSLRILLAVSDTIYFDERLQVAKGLIDDCINRWARGSSSEIRALVNDAFQVDRQGTVNTARILGLRRLEIDDPQWKQAMDAISDSIQISGTKEYLRFYVRDTTGKYQAIPLDFVAM